MDAKTAFSAAVGWVSDGRGQFEHPVFGLVVLDEDYKRTYRAYPKRDERGYWTDPVLNAAGKTMRFRRRFLAMAHLVALHANREQSR